MSRSGRAGTPGGWRGFPGDPIDIPAECARMSRLIGVIGRSRDPAVDACRSARAACDDHLDRLVLFDFEQRDELMNEIEDAPVQSAMRVDVVCAERLSE